MKVVLTNMVLMTELVVNVITDVLNVLIILILVISVLMLPELIHQNVHVKMDIGMILTTNLKNVDHVCINV
jgi:Gpi18-like mannosyltransferase